MALIVAGVVLATVLCIAFTCRICSRLKIKKIQGHIKRPARKGLKVKWSLKASMNEQIESGGPCSICLEEETFAQLSCRHQFHLWCISLWLKKNACCPCCRREGIRRIRVYCNSCHWRYFMVERT